MESSISASKLTPEHEQLAIRDIAMVAESQSKEGDSFFLITHGSPCSLTDFTLSTSNSFDSRCRALKSIRNSLHSLMLH
ncbi:hypothetical protein Scep_007766 [Stephania cephalantha]|uniref:Uncharacterized protein n=1 Tax=Stephania cephalantha TaxID=152367 RepID=A0AAP0KC76_9MAGN